MIIEVPRKICVGACCENLHAIHVLLEHWGSIFANVEKTFTPGMQFHLICRSKSNNMPGTKAYNFKFHAGGMRGFPETTNLKILREWAEFDVFNLLDTICVPAKSDKSQWNDNMIAKIWNNDTLQTSHHHKRLLKRYLKSLKLMIQRRLLKLALVSKWHHLRNRH